MLFFFIFKLKTAYELRISDWSSDVCSSDLRGPGRYGADAYRQRRRRYRRRCCQDRIDRQRRNRGGGGGAAGPARSGRNAGGVRSGDDRDQRPEERRVGKEGVSTGKTRRLP